MRITVKCYGFIEEMAGREAEFDLSEDASVRELLTSMADRYGTRFIEELLEFGQKDLRHGFLCSLNGVPIGQLDGIRTKLRNGDKVAFMSLASGG